MSQLIPRLEQNTYNVTIILIVFHYLMIPIPIYPFSYIHHTSCSFAEKESVGQDDIFTSLSNIRTTLAGKWPPQKLIHVEEKLQCRAHGQNGIAIRVTGSFIIGNQFLVCGDGLQVEGLPNFRDLSIDIPSKRMGTFREQFIIERSSIIGRYYIAKQELYISQ